MRRFAALLLAALLAACGDPGPAVIHVEVRDTAGGVPTGALATLISTSTADAITADTVRETGDFTWEIPRAGAAVAAFAAGDSRVRTDRAMHPIVLLPETEATLRVTVVDSGPPLVRLADSTGLHARWAAAKEGENRIRARHFHAFQEWDTGGRQGPLEIDWGRAPDSLLAAIEVEDEPVVRDALWHQLLTLGQLGAELEQETWSRLLQAVPPTSPVWAAAGTRAATEIAFAARQAEAPTETAEAAPGRDTETEPDRAAASDPEAAPASDPEAVAGRRALASRRAAEYFRRGAAEHPDPSTRATMLLGGMRMAVELGETERAVGLYERLQAEHPETLAFRYARAEAPGVALEEGDTIPALAFPPLDSTADPITPAELRGHTVLIDFWAVWCTPCVAEMPRLHAAHERFADRGFEILSVSYDDRRATVEAFRDEKWPMPWLHSFVGVDSLSEGSIAVRYGVMGLPTAMLVDPAGRVLAIDEGLRGDALAETLEEVLGPGSPGG
jgi:thiol-disulfide isomerase/thioredoxin